MKLKDFILELQKEDPELEVVIASDAEGNEYSKYADYFISKAVSMPYCVYEMIDEDDESEYDEIKNCIVLNRV